MELPRESTGISSKLVLLYYLTFSYLSNFGTMRSPRLSASLTICHLSSSQIHHHTPSFTKKSPTISPLKHLALCYPCLSPFGRTKLQFKTTPCVFIGYSPHHKGYKCLDPCSGWITYLGTLPLMSPPFPTPLS